MKKLFFISLTSLLLISCASTKFARKAMLIENGMPKKEVLSILGTPDDRQFRMDEEIWTYRFTDLDKIKYYFVWFRNDRVTSLTSDEADSPDNSYYRHGYIDGRAIPADRRR
jgi:hypothetical protein